MNLLTKYPRLISKKRNECSSNTWTVTFPDSTAQVYRTMLLLVPPAKRSFNFGGREILLRFAGPGAEHACRSLRGYSSGPHRRRASGGTWRDQAAPQSGQAAVWNRSHKSPPTQGGLLFHRALLLSFEIAFVNAIITRDSLLSFWGKFHLSGRQLQCRFVFLLSRQNIRMSMWGSGTE